MSSAINIQVEPEHQFHRLPALKSRYGVSTSTLYRWMAEGRFPSPIKLGPGAVAWRESALREFDADPTGWAERNAALMVG